MHNEIDKSQFLAKLHMEHAFLMRTLSYFSFKQMLIPNVQGMWSIKDTVAHLSAWLQRVINWIEIAQNDGKPAIPETGYTLATVDLDILNDICYQADKNRPLDNILVEFNTRHWQAVRLVEELSEADLFEHNFHGAFREPPWRLIAGNAYKHYHDHTVPLRTWLASRPGFQLD